MQFRKFKLTQFQANTDRLCWYILLHDDGSDNIHNVQGKGDICRCCRKRPCRFRSRLFMGSFVQHEKVSICYLIIRYWRLFQSYYLGKSYRSKLSLFFSNRFDDMYELVLQYKDGKTGQTCEESFNRSCADFFDENGVLCFDLLENAVLKLHKTISNAPAKKNL